MGYAATIVVPLRQQLDAWLDQSVRSALLQSAPTEVIVVRAEATPPQNLKVLETLQDTFPNLSVLLRDKPESFPGAINTGIRHASADRVGLLFSDDWLDQDTVVTCLRRDADIVSTGNVTYYPNGRINERACRNPSIEQFDALYSLEEKASYLGHFFLFGRQCLRDAGGLDETLGDYPGIDDFDLIWTLLERRATVSIISRGLYHVRDHEGDRLTLKDAASATANLRKILRKHRVPDDEMEHIVAKHARWYGRPVHQTLADDE